MKELTNALVQVYPEDVWKSMGLKAEWFEELDAHDSRRFTIGLRLTDYSGRTSTTRIAFTPDAGPMARLTPMQVLEILEACVALHIPGDNSDEFIG